MPGVCVEYRCTEIKSCVFCWWRIFYFTPGPDCNSAVNCQILYNFLPLCWLPCSKTLGCYFWTLLATPTLAPPGRSQLCSFPRLPPSLPQYPTFPVFPVFPTSQYCWVSNAMDYVPACLSYDTRKVIKVKSFKVACGFYGLHAVHTD